MSLAYDSTTATAASRRAPPLALEHVDCLQCGRNDDEPLVAAPDPLTHSGGEFRVVRCRHCGFAFTNPRPTPASIGRFYPADYSCHDLQASIDNRWRARWRRHLEQAVLRSFYGYPPQPAGIATRLLARIGRARIRTPYRRIGWIPFRGEGRLLDFGCGAGGFLRRMRELGWSVEGIDVSADVAHAVERATGIRVHVGSLPHPGLDQASFDVVTMWQALEHVHWPRDVVRQARQLLRPRGWLAVAVPNLASWSFGAFRQHWFGLELPRHLSHFTPESLSAMLASEGFRIERLAHLGTDGWIRQSARRARAAQWGSWWLSACRHKPLALRLARWSERAAQADCILALAERV